MHRSQDYDDLRALLRGATPEEIDRARAAVREIVAIGAGRERKLEDALETAVAELCNN